MWVEWEQLKDGSSAGEPGGAWVVVTSSAFSEVCGATAQLAGLGPCAGEAAPRGGGKGAVGRWGSLTVRRP